MRIQPRLYLSPPHLSGKEAEHVSSAFADNWIAPVGPQLNRFEERFARRIGSDHAVAVSSGTAALHLVLRHLDLCPGDEVICSTFTFCASANPIRYERAEPVFIDSDFTSWNMAPDLLEEELTECARRGKLPKAIIVVDILGHSADMDAITTIARGYEIPVIEDAAQALGSTYKGRSVGSAGWASAFSFNGNKIITTSTGGMICTNDGRLAERARFFAAQARDPAPYYLHSEIGYNYGFSNILAAIGLAQLDVLDQRVAMRRRIRDFYRRELGNLPGVSFMPEASYTRSNCWLTALLVDSDMFGASSGEICSSMEKRNIEARRLWKPLHMQPAFSAHRCRGGKVASHLFHTGVCLPSGTAMTDDDLRRVVEAFQELARR